MTRLQWNTALKEWYRSDASIPWRKEFAKICYPFAGNPPSTYVPSDTDLMCLYEDRAGEPYAASMEEGVSVFREKLSLNSACL